MDRTMIFQYVEDAYGTEPEYLWADAPGFAVLRNTDRKWYGIVMDVPRNKLGLDGEETVDILNVKCGKLLPGSLRMKPGYLPAYHMNKEQWISILLDGSVPGEEIRALIDLSYDLTRKKTKRKSAER